MLSAFLNLQFNFAKVRGNVMRVQMSKRIQPSQYYGIEKGSSCLKLHIETLPPFTSIPLKI